MAAGTSPGRHAAQQRDCRESGRHMSWAPTAQVCNHLLIMSQLF